MNDKALDVIHHLTRTIDRERAESANLRSTVTAYMQTIETLQREKERLCTTHRKEIESIRRNLKLCDMPTCFTPGCTSDHK